MFIQFRWSKYTHIRIFFWKFSVQIYQSSFVSPERMLWVSTIFWDFFRLFLPMYELTYVLVAWIIDRYDAITHPINPITAGSEGVFQAQGGGGTKCPLLWERPLKAERKMRIVQHWKSGPRGMICRLMKKNLRKNVMERRCLSSKFNIIFPEFKWGKTWISVFQPYWAKYCSGTPDVEVLLIKHIETEVFCFITFFARWTIWSPVTILYFGKNRIFWL